MNTQTETATCIECGSTDTVASITNPFGQEYDVCAEHASEHGIAGYSKPKVTVEPKSTAEAICEHAGVPKGMADKMVVMTIG